MNTNQALKLAFTNAANRAREEAAQKDAMTIAMNMVKDIDSNPSSIEKTAVSQAREIIALVEKTAAQETLELGALAAAGMIQVATKVAVSRTMPPPPVDNTPVPREDVQEFANVLRYTMDQLAKYDRPLALKIVEERVKPIMMKIFGRLV